MLKKKKIMGDVKQIMCGNIASKNQSWCIITQDSALKDAIVCYNRTISTGNTGLWRTENPFTSTVPEFTLQLVLILLLNTLLIVIFKLLHVPRISAEILVSFFFLFPLCSLIMYNLSHKI